MSKLDMFKELYNFEVKLELTMDFEMLLSEGFTMDEIIGIMDTLINSPYIVSGNKITIKISCDTCVTKTLQSIDDKIRHSVRHNTICKE